MTTALTRHIVYADWREDPANAEWYLETALHMVRNTKMTKRGTEYPNAFTYWMRRFDIPQTRILDEDESFMLASYECGTCAAIKARTVRAAAQSATCDASA